MMNEWNRQLCLFSSTSVDISVKSGKHEQKSTYKFNMKRYNVQIQPEAIQAAAEQCAGHKRRIEHGGVLGAAACA
jgi:hypothetical protein